MNLSQTEKCNYEKLGIKTTTNRFKRYYRASLLDKLDESFINNLQKYWEKNYKRQVDPILNVAYLNLTGEEDYRVVPAKVMNHVIKPFFNDNNMSDGYKDKNIYDMLIKTRQSVEIVLKCVRGKYFDYNNNILNVDHAHKRLLHHESLIIKPSTSNNGVGVSKLTVQNEEIKLQNKEVNIDELKERYNHNFTIEKVIEQHPIMATPHPQSVNTLRMVTFRWSGTIHYLLTFARFGSNGDVRDNAGAGGLCLGVNDSGNFFDIAVDENARTHTHHPTTGYYFADLESIPNFKDFIQFVLDGHKNILHHDFVSWDIAVGAYGQPIFIEANFSGATWLYQLAAQRPMFGGLTEEVLQHVSRELEINPLIKSKDQRIKELDKKIKTKNRKIKELDREKKHLKAQFGERNEPQQVENQH